VDYGHFNRRAGGCTEPRTRAVVPDRTPLARGRVILIVRLNMSYPPQIERLRSVLRALPGVIEVEADHMPLQDIKVQDMSLVPLADLPHATIRRTSGGLPAEALGQIFITFSPTVESWRTLEFVSWQVRDWSRSGRNIQIRTRGLPPMVGEQIQLGSSLRAIIEFFVAGLDADPERLLREMDEFGADLGDSVLLYSLDWHEGAVKKKGEPGGAANAASPHR